MEPSHAQMWTLGEKLCNFFQLPHGSRLIIEGYYACDVFGYYFDGFAADIPDACNRLFIRNMTYDLSLHVTPDHIIVPDELEKKTWEIPYPQQGVEVPTSVILEDGRIFFKTDTDMLSIARCNHALEVLVSQETFDNAFRNAMQYC